MKCPLAEIGSSASHLKSRSGDSCANGKEASGEVGWRLKDEQIDVCCSQWLLHTCSAQPNEAFAARAAGEQFPEHGQEFGGRDRE